MESKRVTYLNSEHDTENPPPMPPGEQTKRLREFLSEAVLVNDHVRVSALKEELERQLREAESSGEQCGAA